MSSKGWFLKQVRLAKISRQDRPQWLKDMQGQIDEQWQKMFKEGLDDKN